MILPIIGYGDPVLRKVGEEVSKDYPNLKEVIANVYESIVQCAWCRSGSSTSWFGHCVFLLWIANPSATATICRKKKLHS